MYQLYVICWPSFLETNIGTWLIIGQQRYTPTKVFSFDLTYNRDCGCHHKKYEEGHYEQRR